MPLEVTTGPPNVVAGSGPPGPAGSSDAPQATGDLAALFAALLSQQGQTASGGLPKTPSAVPETAVETDAPKEDRADAADTQSSPVQGQVLDPTTINWAALAALQTQTPVLAQTAISTGETPVSRAPITQTEVMDTASRFVPAAPAAKTDIPSSGLLPLSTIPQASPDALSASGVVGSATTGTDAQINASPLNEPLTQTPARVAPPAVTEPLFNAPPLPKTLAGVADKVGDVAPATQAVVPFSVPVAAAALTQPVPSLPSVALPPVIPTGEDTSLNIAVANIPAIMPGLKAKPALTGAAFKAPVTALPADQPRALTGMKLPTETATQIALQNSVIPANNTGKTETPPETQAAGSAETPTAAEGAKATAPGAAPVIEPDTVNPTKAVLKPKAQGGQGQTLPQANVLKSANRPATDDQATQASQDAASRSKDTAAVADTGVLPTVLTSPEPRASTTAIPEKPLTGAERAQVVRQTADGISTIKPQVLATGQGQMTLNLHPKEWGDLRVTVQLAPAPAIDGVKQTTVVAHVVASSPAVKTALEKHSSDLNQALRETGLHLERLTVTVQAASAGEQSGGAASDSRNFGQKNQDQWQGAPSQTPDGSGGMGAGSSSSFASYSERQGGGPYQGRSPAQSAYTGGDESDTDLRPVSSRSSQLNTGFDQRA